MTRRRLLGHVMSALLLAVGIGWGGIEQTRAQDADRLQVITTFSVLGDIVAQVGGDAVDVVVLVPAGADAHDFEPSPTDVGSLEDAMIVFENGLEFEPWLDDLYEAAASDATRVVVTDGITPREAGDHDEHEGEEHDDASPDAGDHADEGDDHDEEDHDGDDHDGEDDHEHGEYDPHVWHDVANVIQEVEAVRAALVAADPDYEATYEANAAAYTAELEALDAYVVEQVATLPEERRKLVTSHDTFGYFAARYGFEVLGTALGSVSTEGGDPSAQEINDLVEEIEACGVPAIFAENVTDISLMETIADEAGVTLAPTLYTDALGEPGSPGETYLGMIRVNVDAIVGALAS